MAGESFCALFAGSYAHGTIARYQTIPAGIRFESSSVPAGGTLDILFARTSGLPSTSTSIGVERAAGGANAGTSSVLVHASRRIEINGPPAIAAPDTTPPSVPRGLSARTVTTSAVTLSWSPSSDVDGAVERYKIFRNGTQVGTAMANSYTDGKLSPSTSYTYTVAAYDTAGNSSARAEYLVYQPGGGSFTVNLSACSGKTFSVEWFNVRTNTTTAGHSVKGGRTSQSFTPPFSDDAVLHLKSR